jgi:hypothetical protein
MATAVYVGNIPLCWQFIAHVFKVGTWASFGSEQRPPPGNKKEPGARPERKRFIHSMLPASLWSTNAPPHDGGESALRTLADGNTGLSRMLTQTTSEEAIICHDVESEEMELETIPERNYSLTSAERVPSRGIT